MRAEPRSFQADAVSHHVGLLRSRGATAEGSVPGFGKTFVAAFVAREMNHELVVACPKVVIPHWRAAAEAAGAKVRCVSNYEQHKLGHTQMGQWKIKNRQWQWTFPKPTLLVLDEAHVMKTRTSQNAKFAVAAKRQGIPTMVMSATLAQDPTDLYAVGYLLGLHGGDTMMPEPGLQPFRSWQFQYGVLPVGFDFKFCPLHDPTALPRLNAELFPKRGHRKTYDEIPGFPSATTDVREVEGDPEALEIMEAAWARTKELEQLHEDALTAAVQRTRARQIAELAKVPAMVDLARDLMASGLSVPIFVNYHDTLNAIEHELKCRIVSGAVSERDRTTAIARFQANEDHCLAVQTEAGGVGVSLHDIHHQRPRHGIYSPGDNAVAFVQALGRVRRDGGTPCFRTVLTLAGSIERRVHRNLTRKIEQIDTINDGDLDPLA